MGEAKRKAAARAAGAAAPQAPAQPAGDPEPGVNAPGVTKATGRCAGCGVAVRNAILLGPDLTTPAIRVDARPTEYIMPNGRVLPLFTPHDNTCQNPKAIHLPDGRKLLIG